MSRYIAIITLAVCCAPICVGASETPRSQCIVSDQIASAVFGQPMHGHPMGSSCAFTSSRDDSVAILRVWTSHDAVGSQTAPATRSADAAFDSYRSDGTLHFVDVNGIGDRAKFGNPNGTDRAALQLFVTQQAGTVVTIYAKKSQLLQSEALALNVFHQMP